MPLSILAAPALAIGLSAAQADGTEADAVLDSIQASMLAQQNELITELRNDFFHMDELAPLPQRDQLAAQLYDEIAALDHDAPSSLDLIEEGILADTIRIIPFMPRAAAEHLRSRVEAEIRYGPTVMDVFELGNQLGTAHRAARLTGQPGFALRLVRIAERQMGDNPPRLNGGRVSQIEQMGIRLEIFQDLGAEDAIRSELTAIIDLILEADDTAAIIPPLTWSAAIDPYTRAEMGRLASTGGGEALGAVLDTPGPDRLAIALTQTRLQWLDDALNGTPPPPPTALGEEIAQYYSALLYALALDLGAHDHSEAALAIAETLTELTPAHWNPQLRLTSLFIHLGAADRAAAQSRIVTALIPANAPVASETDDPDLENLQAHAHVHYWTNLVRPRWLATELAEAGYAVEAIELLLATQRSESALSGARLHGSLIQFFDQLSSETALNASLAALWDLPQAWAEYQLDMEMLYLVRELGQRQRDSELIRLAALYSTEATAQWVSPETRNLLLRSAWTASLSIDGRNDYHTAQESFRARAAILAALPD